MKLMNLEGRIIPIVTITGYARKIAIIVLVLLFQIGCTKKSVQTTSESAQSVRRYLFDNINLDAYKINSTGDTFGNIFNTTVINSLGLNLYKVSFTTEQTLIILEDKETKAKCFLDCEFFKGYFGASGLRDSITLPSTYPIILNNDLIGLQELLNQSQFIKELDSIPISGIDTIVLEYLYGSSNSHSGFTKVNLFNADSLWQSYESSRSYDSHMNKHLIRYCRKVFLELLTKRSCLIYSFSAGENNYQQFYFFNLKTKQVDGNSEIEAVRNLKNKVYNKRLIFELECFVI